MKKMLSVILIFLATLQLSSSDINWTFPPVTLSTLTASDPHIAMDSNGNVVAVWVENGFIKSKSKLANMSWSALAATLSSTGASWPRVVSDASGNATAVWVENGVIKAASKTLNGSWGASVTLSGTGASSPSLAVDLAGNVIAVWAKSGDVGTATKLFNANWQTQVAINSTSAALPHIAIGGSGANTIAYVVWQGVSGSTNVVFASSKTISGSWSAQQVISDANFNAGYAHVAVDTNANATAVWYLYSLTGSNYSNVVVQASSKPSGGVWSSRTCLSEPGIRNPATLLANVAYDGSGNAIALWNTSFNDETFAIQSSIKPVRSGWSDTVTLVDDSLYSFQGDLAVTSLGDAISLYMFYNGVALQIQSAELDVTNFMNSIWSVPLNVSAGDKNANPDVVATLTGNVINSATVWISSNGLINSVSAITGNKTLVLPPSVLSVTQSSNNFGVFTEYYNTLSWHASTDPTVVGYLIYRNGVFIGQVNASTLSIVDDNRVQNGSVTYGVAAIDAEQSHSKIITVSFP